MRPILFTPKALLVIRLCLCILLLAALAQPAAAQSSTVAKPQVTYKLISGEHNTWGYDIYIEGKLRIHQPSVPALPGNDGFKTKDQCKIAAKLVIEKIRAGKMPPSVTADELKKAGAI